jgi:hypothetical protein
MSKDDYERIIAAYVSSFLSASSVPDGRLTKFETIALRKLETRRASRLLSIRSLVSHSAFSSRSIMSDISCCFALLGGFCMVSTRSVEGPAFIPPP